MHYPISNTPMWQGTSPIAPDRRELSPQVTEGASGRCGCGLLMGLYLLIVTDSLCQFYGMPSYDRSQKPDRPGEVPPPTVQSPLRPLAPSVLGLRPKPPPSRREVLRRAAAVNACTVPMFSLLI